MRKASTVQKLTIPAPDVSTKVVPVPTDGWDAISPLASMDPKRAPILNNWIPRPGWVELRQGYFPWAYISDDRTKPVETLMVRRAGGSEQMFAAIGSEIYDVSSTGTAVTPAVTGLNSARWQYCNFTPALGTTVIQCVNGVDTLRQYNGTSWSVPAITGLPNSLNTSAITNIHAQKRRLWYVLGNGSGGGSTVSAFMPTDAISGAIAGTIDLGANWSKGGYLIAIADWTVDGGNGPQDYMVFISSRGQVSIFSGTDPTSSTAWTLAGTFDMAPPIGQRCATKIGSDVGLITQQGVIPLSQALPFDPSAERSVAITARIQNAMANAAANGTNLFGWQLIAFAPQTLSILNVPQVENATQVQFVMNTLTGAWCQFTGWNANCFEIHNNTLFFGGNLGDVNECFVGSSDFTSSIIADMQCAYNYFDAPGRLKRITMVQPFITAGQSVSPYMSIDADFQIQPISAPIQILKGGAVWGFETVPLGQKTSVASASGTTITMASVAGIAAGQVVLDFTTPAAIPGPSNSGPTTTVVSVVGSVVTLSNAVTGVGSGDLISFYTIPAPGTTTSAVWDTSIWFGGSVQTTNWLSAEALGHALAVHLTVNITTAGGGATQGVFDFSFFDQGQWDLGINTTSTVLQVNAFNTILEMGGFI